jgi:hypothetical protein
LASGSTRSGICTPVVRCGPFTKVNRCIAEGRKSFLARYASIESGEECDRWAPVVSAMIDGEATPQQVLDVRPHLRNCSACRAVMRDADRQSASLAALFPVGAGVGAGGGQAVPAPDAGGFLARIYEAVASTVHERAVASAIKVQAALDAATAGKVAAVAASAAAVAGGGVAVVERTVPDRSRAERAVAQRAPAAANDAAQAAARHAKGAAQATASRPAARQPASRQSATASEFGSRSGDGGSRQVSREFGTSPARASTASATSPATSSTPAPVHRNRSPVEESGEFGP